MSNDNINDMNDDDFMDELLEVDDEPSESNDEADPDFDLDESFDVDDILPDTDQLFDEDETDNIDDLNEDSLDESFDDDLSDDLSDNADVKPKNKMIPIAIGIGSFLVLAVGGGLYYAMSNGSQPTYVAPPVVKASLPAINPAVKSVVPPVTKIEKHPVENKIKNPITVNNGFGENSPSVNKFNDKTVSIDKKDAKEVLDNSVSLIKKGDKNKLSKNDIKSNLSDILSNKRGIDELKASISKISDSLDSKFAMIDKKVMNLTSIVNKERPKSIPDSFGKKPTPKTKIKTKTLVRKSTENMMPMVMPIKHRSSSVLIKDSRIVYETKYIIDGTVWLQQRGKHGIAKYTIGDTLDGYGIIRGISSENGVMTVNGYILSPKPSGRNVVSESKPVIVLIGAVDGRASVKSPSNKKVYPLVVGDIIKGYGRVTSISSNGIIRSETGVVKTILR